MSEIFTVGLDLAKNVFLVHEADGSGHAVLRKKLRWAQAGLLQQAFPLCEPLQKPSPSTTRYATAGHFRVAVVLRFTQKRNTNVSLDPKAQH